MAHAKVKLGEATADKNGKVRSVVNKGQQNSTRQAFNKSVNDYMAKMKVIGRDMARRNAQLDHTIVNLVEEKEKLSKSTGHLVNSCLFEFGNHFFFNSRFIYFNRRMSQVQHHVTVRKA